MFSVDPGGPVLGWAKWDSGKLVACGLSRTKAKTPFQRALDHKACLASLGAYPGRVVCEAMWYRPVTYIDVRGKKRKKTVPPQDIIDLNLIAGHVGNIWRVPHDWKGMVSKEIHQPKILQCLSPEELALVEAVKPPSLRHNCIDAIGIGLHDNGRLQGGDKCNNETSQQVRSLIESLSGSSSGSSPTRLMRSGSTSKRSTTPATRGKRQRAPSSYITLPKGSLKLGPMARATAARSA